MRTRAVAETGTRTRTGTRTGTGWETGKGLRTEMEGTRRRTLVSATSGNKQAEWKTRYCHSARVTISDKRWHLQVVSSFGRKTRRVLNDVGSRPEQGTRDGREETVTGTGTGLVTEMRTGTGMTTRAGMGVRTGVGTGARIEIRVKRRESLGTYEGVIEVGQKTREGGDANESPATTAARPDAQAR